MHPEPTPERQAYNEVESQHPASHSPSPSTSHGHARSHSPLGSHQSHDPFADQSGSPTAASHRGTHNYPSHPLSSEQQHPNIEHRRLLDDDKKKEPYHDSERTSYKPKRRGFGAKLWALKLWIAWLAVLAGLAVLSAFEIKNFTGKSNVVTTGVSALVASLYAASTMNGRYKLLGQTGLKFDFFAAPSFGGGGKDGGVVLADNTVFPGVVGQNMAMLMGFLGPCGMVAPHIHPRATEYLLNIVGPPLSATSIAENGAGVSNGNLEPGNVVVLPRGSMHVVSSTGCDPTVIMAVFNAESPGVLLLSTGYQGLNDPESINAAFGDIGAKVFNDSAIPANVMLGRQDCLNKCGINRASFDISSTTKKELMKQAVSAYLSSVNYTMY